MLELCSLFCEIVSIFICTHLYSRLDTKPHVDIVILIYYTIFDNNELLFYVNDLYKEYTDYTLKGKCTIRKI